MSQDATPSVSADVTSSENFNDISDAQVEKFFESGGKDLPTNEEIEEQSTTETPHEEKEQKPLDEKPEDKELKEKQAREEQNYKGMAAEERAKRKELQDRLDRLEAIFKRAAEPPPPQIPSYDENPLDHLRIKQEQMEAFIKSQNEQLQNQYHETQVRQNQQHFINVYQKSLNDYKAANTQADAAFAFLRDSKIKEYQAIGIPNDKIPKLLHDDEMLVVQQSSKDGISPFDRLYAAAVARGFQPNQPTQAAPQNQQLENKMAQIERGSQVSRTLSNAKSKSSGEISLESLLKMDSDEQDEFVRKHWDKLKKIMP